MSASCKLWWSSIGSFESVRVSPADRALLAGADVERLLTNALNRLFDPLMRRNSRRILLGDANAQVVPSPPLDLEGDWITVQTAHDPAILITARTEQLAALDDQLEWVRALDTLRDDLEERFDVSILQSGGVFHAAGASGRAAAEVAILGGISFIAVVAVVWAVLGSAWPLAATTAVVASAIVAGGAAVAMFSGATHVLSFVLGTTVIGLCVDYALHFFCERYIGEGSNALTAARRIATGTGLALVTTAAGWLVLTFSPLVLLRDAGIFTAAGLAAAWITVMLVLPVVSSGSAAPRAGRLGRVLSVALTRTPRGPVRWLGIAACAALAAGVTQLHVNDDIRQLYAPDPVQLDADRAVMQRFGSDVDSRFVVVVGDDADSVLQRSELAIESLQTAIAAGALRDFAAIARVVPSQATQSRDRELMAVNVYAPGALLDQLAERAGLPEDWVAAQRRNFTTSEMLLLDDWWNQPVAAETRHLWVEQTDAPGAATAVQLYGLADPAAVAALMSTVPGAHWIDPVAATSEVMGAAREQMSWVVLVAGMMMALIALVRYGLKNGVGACLASATGLVVVLGTLGWLGYSVSLFHMAALLLVLGLGVDYALIPREGAKSDDVESTAGAIRHDSGARVAVAASALTTLASFGLLSQSSTPAVAAVGLTLSLGIAANAVAALWLFPPAASPRRPYATRSVG